MKKVEEENERKDEGKGGDVGGKVEDAVEIVPPVCSVCLDGVCDAVIQPCGHASCCNKCAKALKSRKKCCPRCNTRVRGIVVIRL